MIYYDDSAVKVPPQYLQILGKKSKIGGVSREKRGLKMDKKLLIIMNPRSGTMRANKHLTEIVEVFVEQGYLPTTLVTTKQGDGTEYVKEYGAGQDLILCIGGDGTFNEVASGIVESGLRIPVGYIPAGSTNDFASSLGLSRDVILNAKGIAHGEKKSIDLGSFNGRPFSYIASFGAFTKASYATPQSIKNSLGHLAYILEGVKEGLTALTSLKPIRMSIEADGVLYEGDYLLGAVSNSTSIAGILTLKREYVDMSDGLFELLLIQMPKDLLELTELLHMISLQNFYESNLITFVNAKEFHIKADKDLSWTLDGEYQEGAEDIVIRNMHHAIDLVMKKKEPVIIDSVWKGREIRYE